MSLDFYNPVRIISGEGCVRSFDGFSSFGSKAIIVCGRSSAKACGALGDVIKGLSDAGIGYTVFDRVMQNPLLETCFEGGTAARGFGASFVIGIGGGSPLDAAKAVAVFAANPKMAAADLFSSEKRNPALPILAVNTTAGTGSEVTPYSVLTVRFAQNKRSFSGDDIFPKIAFLDPAYTYSLPPRFTASTAVDALSHAVEGYFMKKANAISDALAEKAIPAICAGLRKIAFDKVGTDTRKELLYASTMAGMVISRTGTGFVHSMGYMLTYNHDIPHGEANAYFLADFVDFMSIAEPEKSARVYSLAGVDGKKGLAALLKSVLPLDFKAPDVILREYAAVTAKSKNVQNAVRTIDEEALFDIYRRRCAAVKL